MPDPGLDALARQLRGTPPAGLAALSEEHLHHLADAVHGARKHQAEQLRKAGQAALDQLPALIRIPVKRIIG